MFSLNSFAVDLGCEGVIIDEEQATAAVEEVFYEEGADVLRDRLQETLSAIEKIKTVERYAIKLYTQQTYKKINGNLRAGLPPYGYENYYSALCAGLSRQEKYQGRVYRIVELPKDVQKFYENNSEYTEQAFMSTSMSKSSRRIFENNTNKNYNTYFYIQSKTGRDISKVSVWPEEREVLFPAGTRFKITETFRPYLTNYLYVWLQEI